MKFALHSSVCVFVCLIKKEPSNTNCMSKAPMRNIPCGNRTLCVRLDLFWCGRRDSNPYPERLAPKTSASAIPPRPHDSHILTQPVPIVNWDRLSVKRGGASPTAALLGGQSGRGSGLIRSARMPSECGCRCRRAAIRPCTSVQGAAAAGDRRQSPSGGGRRAEPCWCSQR